MPTASSPTGASVILGAHGLVIGADIQLDHITTGPLSRRGHFGLCGADDARLNDILG